MVEPAQARPPCPGPLTPHDHMACLRFGEPAPAPSPDCPFCRGKQWLHLYGDGNDDPGNGGGWAPCDGPDAKPDDCHEGTWCIRPCPCREVAALKEELAALRAHIATMNFTKYHAALTRAEALEAALAKHHDGTTRGCLCQFEVGDRPCPRHAPTDEDGTPFEFTEEQLVCGICGARAALAKKGGA